jgi:prevent-host-death family protein
MPASWEVILMLRKISTADARKKFANIVNRVAFGKEAFVLTRRGEALAALVSVDALKLLQEIEERMDVEDAWQARADSEETVSWEELKKELKL